MWPLGTRKRCDNWEEFGPHDFLESTSGKALASNGVLSLADLVGKVALLPVWSAGWTVEYYLPTGAERKSALIRTLKNNTMGYFTKSLTPDQLRVLVPVRPLRRQLRSSEYEATAAELHNFNKMFPGDGFSARWIHEVPGRTEDDPVILFLHGGGYVLKISSIQVKWVIWLARQLKGKRVSVLCLDYTVTKFAVFPAQLTEATLCYNQLVSPKASGATTVGCKRVILFGESCGGHLSLDMLQHRAHPVPGVPHIDDQEVWGLAFVSPWVCLDTKRNESFRTNERYDIIDARSLDIMKTMFLPTDGSCTLDDPIINPIAAVDRDYWKGLIPERAVAVWGADEVLRDSCREFMANSGIPNVFEEHNAPHDCMLQSPPGDASRFIAEAILKWL